VRSIPLITASRPAVSRWTRNVEKLVPYIRNPRKNDDAVTRMVASLTEFGFKIPMLVRSDGEIVDGHLRLKAARKLGMTEVPIIRCDEWSAAQVVDGELQNWPKATLGNVE
jgi:ParB-like nuclease domain